MPQQCIVSFVDPDGLRHSVEVQAGSMYEAAALALRTFRHHKCGPGEASRFEVEVRSSVVHTITVRRVQEWLGGSAKDPKEAATKHRLRELLTD
jgi:hypothetical protein